METDVRNIADYPGSMGEVSLVTDERAKLNGVIVIHSTKLGPAAGGCRFWTYESHQSMIDDAVRLAEAMSYKNAIAALPFGGGKAVLRRPDGRFDRTRLFEAFGEAVDRFHGRYVTAEDVGTNTADMSVIARMTRHVAGGPASGGAARGDPSPWTARGVFLAMSASCERHLGQNLGDCTVAIQGVGNVGSHLARLLKEAGAGLIIADIDQDRATRLAGELHARLSTIDQILSVEADVFAPCALGAVLHHGSIPCLRARVVCGAANNQLATSADGKRLRDRQVLYAPDYVVNAGGIISVAAERLGWSVKTILERINEIPHRLLEVLNIADRGDLATNLAADAFARKLIGLPHSV